MLVVVALVLAVLGVRIAVVQAGSRPVELAPGSRRPAVLSSAPASLTGSTATGARSGPVVTAAADGPASAAAATSGPAVVVHVVGRVAHPGVVRLPVGARVQQAVAAAGGARRGADLSRVNLARLLVDGEQLVVPRAGEVVAAAPGPAVPGGPGTSGGSAPAGGAAPAVVVDLNSAGMAELDSLPGVGPVLAQRILDWRQQNGRFTSVDELGEVSGIGDAVLGRLRPLVRV
jgi:competence protein ComEA